MHWSLNLGFSTYYVCELGQVLTSLSLSFLIYGDGDYPNFAGSLCGLDEIRYKKHLARCLALKYCQWHFYHGYWSKSEVSKLFL